MVSPFDLSRTLPVGGGLLVLCSLSGPPIQKQLNANGYYGAWPGWMVSISVLPLTDILLTLCSLYTNAIASIKLLPKFLCVI